MSADQQAAFLLITMLGATIVEWPSDEPCPCGSSRKFKYCHGSVKS